MEQPELWGINLPLCSAYNDRLFKGERVSVGRQQLLSLGSLSLCICMLQEGETLLSNNVIYWKWLLHCVFHSQFDNSSYTGVAAVNTLSYVITAVREGELICFVLIFILSVYVPGIPSVFCSHYFTWFSWQLYGLDIIIFWKIQRLQHL
jgi:hypothetical protein